MVHSLLRYLLVTLLPLAASSQRPHVTSVHVDKSEHTLELRDGDDVVKTYRVAIGPGGAGPKHYEGDNVTPTGTYKMWGRIALFHRFINVSYPNDEDRKRFAAAKARGEIPEGRSIGFGIGVHGVGVPEWNGVHKEHDWTAGCIALDDKEIDEVASLVPDGTPLVIED